MYAVRLGLRYVVLILFLLSLLAGALAPWDHGGVDSTSPVPDPTPTATSILGA